jgi:hypothetical protein
MSKFEDHLWREFVREHGHDLAQVRRAAARPSLRPRVVAAGGLGLAGAGVGLALALGATTAAPAFAVTRNHDGTVTVDILRSSGVAGANAKLHQLGVRAEVMSKAPADCQVYAFAQVAATSSHQIANVHWTIDPRTIPAARTLVLTPASEGNSGNSGNRGQVSSCPNNVMYQPARPVSGNSGNS